MDFIFIQLRYILFNIILGIYKLIEIINSKLDY